MIVQKTERELALMREACRISAAALKIAGEAVKPGVSTWEIDRIAHNYIISQGADPNILGCYGFPASACISVNSEVIHGIPSKKRILKEGDMVSFRGFGKFKVESIGGQSKKGKTYLTVHKFI